MDTNEAKPAKSKSALRQFLDENYEGTVILEPYFLDEAIIGISTDGRLIYDYDKLVECFIQHDGMDYEGAVEWVDYNTVRAIEYMGEMKPIILNKIDIE